ncbi:sodium/proline symporter PutP [Paraferrimonas sedimenticola]|uniref:Sodium/proline symporter n=1 Tax=Paraferrimonas sedimenticola TaxID=375674 RepID=A0AA37RWQ1_9GAMM|nr:sodium/proline symporter PutP [Paraferrimonas sedimenticola]GLP96604.1 sodium:proline symporter [Paraferrimonas sedimenticola]
MSVSSPVLITFIGYLVLMIGIGFVAYRATTNVGDYILGGRKMGPAVTALSVGASDMSGWLLLGLPGAVYLGGLSEAWIGIGLLLGAGLNWMIIAKRLRVYTYSADDALTIPEFLESRFNDKGGVIRTFAAAVILLFFTFYASSGLVGGAILFEKVFGLDYITALIIGSVVIVTYTFVGGFFAVSWTDFFQGCLMLVALLMVPAVLLNDMGGWEHASQVLPDNMTQLISPETTAIGLLSLLAWGLGYFGQPHILSRFMAIRSVKDIPTSRRIAMSWMTAALVGALMTGLVGALYFADQPLNNPETVFIQLTQVAFNPWIAGLLIAAILSAIMSTIDSQLLVCSSVITEDVYKKWLRPSASDSELMLVGRLGVLTIAIIAGVIAMNPDSNVLGLVSYAWAGFGAAFGPVVILSLFWRGYSRDGALATLLVGALTVVIWKQLNGGIFELYELLPGFVFALIAGVLVSKLRPNQDQTSLDGFDRYQKTLDS